MFLSFSRNSQIAQKIPRFLISRIAQNSTHYCPKFLHIAQRTLVHPFVHIAHWSDISHFYVQLPLKQCRGHLKTVQRAHFLLKIVRETSNPTNFTEWNHDFIGIFTSYKLQKCRKYNLPQIHHIRTYCNSKVLWYVIILNCVYTGYNLMNCMVLYAQFR